VPTTPASMSALFGEGLGTFLDHAADIHQGLFAKTDFRQMREEAEMLAGRQPGNPAHAPENLQDRTRGLIRDPGLATLGSGNHFCEIQEVSEVLDRHAAYRMGIRPGQLAVMVHTGSRDVGFYVGQRWMDRARAAWPAGLKHPEPALFGLVGTSAREYLGAMHAAANYADANRALVMELVRQRFREVYGDLEMPLVCDVQHNMAFEEGEHIVHRKGATPAHLGQALLIPGSMGDHSYLLEGLGKQAFASSASHGAGRSMSRGQAGRMNANKAAPYFECITLRQERRIEESPSAYKPVTPVVQSQVDNGLVHPVARLSPILTFKA
jgi:tRNA-splicing ligase RtcB (3'-phosphate/5'-hydroxy nucleic acid ligase)